MFDALHTNPTQLVGLLAFALAASACLLAARRRGSPWRMLAILEVACFAEVLIGLRLRLHEAVDAQLQSVGVYASREGWQWALLAGIGFAATLALVAVLRFGAHRRGAAPRSRAATTATLATGFVLLLFAIEAVSLHRIDAVMYAQLGPLLLVGVLWACGGAVVTAAALVATRR